MTDSSVVNVSEYTAPIRRYFLLVLILTLLGAVAGFFFFRAQADVFTSEAKVEVKPLVSQSATPDPDRQINTRTEEEIASSQLVMERAQTIISVAGDDALDTYDDPGLLSEAAGLEPDADQVQDDLEKIEVQVIGDSQILVVRATSSDADEAARLAQAVAVAYIDIRRTGSASGQDQARTALLERQVEIERELASVFAAGAPQSFETLALEEELSQIARTLGDFQASAVDPGSVISDAVPADTTDGLPQFAGPIVGGLLGLIAGLSLGFVLDRQDDRLRSASDELAQLGVPVLGSAPVHLKSKPGISLFANNSVGADSYRRVQASMLFNLDQEGKSLIVISGVKSSRASGFVAANLAAMAARSGRRTLLVGANLRQKPLNDGPGLSDVVLGKSSLPSSVEKLSDVDPNLDLLGGGTSTGRPADILQSEGFGRLLNAIHADYDLVLIDSPALLEVADAVDISRLAQGALIVVDSTSDSRKDIANAIGQVKSVGSSLVGVVITEPSSS